MAEIPELPEAEFLRIQALPEEEFSALPYDLKLSFRHTAMRRLAAGANRGVRVGGLTVEEAARKHQQGQSQQGQQAEAAPDGTPIRTVHYTGWKDDAPA